jgi:hypothetical protein
MPIVPGKKKGVSKADRKTLVTLYSNQIRQMVKKEMNRKRAIAIEEKLKNNQQFEEESSDEESDIDPKNLSNTFENNETPTTVENIDVAPVDVIKTQEERFQIELVDWIEKCPLLNKNDRKKLKSDMAKSKEKIETILLALDDEQVLNSKILEVSHYHLHAAAKALLEKGPINSRSPTMAKEEIVTQLNLFFEDAPEENMMLLQIIVKAPAFLQEMSETLFPWWFGLYDDCRRQVRSKATKQRNLSKSISAFTTAADNFSACPFYINTIWKQFIASCDMFAKSKGTNDDIKCSVEFFRSSVSEAEESGVLTCEMTFNNEKMQVMKLQSAKALALSGWVVQTFTDIFLGVQRQYFCDLETKTLGVGSQRLIERSERDQLLSMGGWVFVSMEKSRQFSRLQLQLIYGLIVDPVATKRKFKFMEKTVEENQNTESPVANVVVCGDINTSNDNLQREGSRASSSSSKGVGGISQPCMVGEMTSDADGSVTDTSDSQISDGDEYDGEDETISHSPIVGLDISGNIVLGGGELVPDVGEEVAEETEVDDTFFNMCNEGAMTRCKNEWYQFIEQIERDFSAETTIAKIISREVTREHLYKTLMLPDTKLRELFNIAVDHRKIRNSIVVHSSVDLKTLKIKMFDFVVKKWIKCRLHKVGKSITDSLKQYGFRSVADNQPTRIGVTKKQI